MQNHISRSKNKHVIILFIISGILLSVRARYGYFFNDEPFIVSLAQRLFYSADLIVDEWNTAQNFGVLLLPLYKLYIALVGKTEGILLTFRVIYCIMWASTCTALYYIIKQKYSGALIVFFYLILFAPLDQMTLSYTSVSLSCCLLIMGLFFFHLEVKPISWFQFTIIYTALSIIAVLSQPYLAVIYVLNAILIVIIHLVKKSETTRFFFKVNLFSCAIAVIAAMLYLYRFVLSDHSFADILQSLRYILFYLRTQDSTFANKLVYYVIWILDSFHNYVLLMGISFVLLHLPFIKNYPKRKYGLFLVDIFIFFAEIAKLAIQCHEPNFNRQMVPIVFLGVIAFFMLDNRKEYLTLFVSFVVYGVLCSLAFYYASDTGIMAISMGLSMCGVASIVFVASLGKQCREYFSGVQANEALAGRKYHKNTSICAKIMALAFVLIFFSQLSLQALLKLERHYWDYPVRYLTSTISEGAGKGIRTTDSNKGAYEKLNESLYKLLKNVNMQDSQNIRFLSMIPSPVIFLDADLPVGCFSTWTFMDDNILLEKLDVYYSTNPSQRPNVIFYMSDDTRVNELNLDLSDFQIFSDNQYSILISSDFVNMAGS